MSEFIYLGGILQLISPDTYLLTVQSFSAIEFCVLILLCVLHSKSYAICTSHTISEGDTVNDLCTSTAICIYVVCMISDIQCMHREHGTTHGVGYTSNLRLHGSHACYTAVIYELLCIYMLYIYIYIYTFIIMCM